MQIEWNKPSEELPESHRTILFVTGDEKRHLGYMDDNECFVELVNTFVLRRHGESEVLAWCYAPSLPEWCEED